MSTKTKMQKLDPKTDGSTANIVEQNVARLKELFPDVFAEGKIDFDTLRDTLGNYIDDRQERYSFTWNGKSLAKRIAQTPSTGTLRPCPKESVNWDTTQNLFIEGDNLEALKLLQKSYHRRVKVIYIDPPYNTGKEFIYPDKFQDNLDTYLRYTGQKDAEGLKLSSNAETSGRYHTSWLNMILPRLKLSRNLLRDDGYIIISIDDAELTNLNKVMQEVFGEENFVATLVWDRNRKNDAKFFSVGHEYMLVYAKDLQRLRDLDTMLRAPKPGIEEVRERFADLRAKHKDNWGAVAQGLRELYASWGDDDPRKPLTRYTNVDERGPYRDDGNINWPGGGGPTYEVLHPVTGKSCKLPTSGWRYPTPERMQEEIAAGHVVFGPDETTVPRVRMNLLESNGQVMQSVHFSYAQTAANEFNALFDGQRVFDNPKHYKDLASLIAYLGDPDSIVLDFFAGSCSTAHAVLSLNADDGGRRRFIMTQLPEPCDEKTEAFKAGYTTIADIGKDRIRRVIKRIKAEQTDKAKAARNRLPGTGGMLPKLDLGFKVFRLDASNIKPWDGDFDNLKEALINAVENIKPDRTEADVLYELLLKYGLDLAVPIEEREIVRKTVYIIGAGALIVCLADRVSLDTVEGIAKLKAELKPEVMRMVFKDAGFKDDVVKTNAVQILRQAGIEDVKSL